MSQNSHSESFTPEGSEHRQKDASATSNANDGPSDSPKEEDLHNARILAHARSVATPPATPMTDIIEMDITSVDVREHSSRLYLARPEIRPPCLTEQDIAYVIRRLEVDLTSAFGKIKAKSHRKPWAESMLMIDMRMSGILKPGSTKVQLRPCIWLVCGSKWCRKIVKSDVKHLVWLSPYDIHFVHKGGPLLSAGEAKPLAEDFDHLTSNASFTIDSCDPLFYQYNEAYNTDVGEYTSAAAYPNSSTYAHGSNPILSSVPPSRSHQTDVKNTISREEPPPERHELPCEFRNLTGCPSIFHGDETQAWMDHIEEHLQGRFPSKLRCWFCVDDPFEARRTTGGHNRSNFIVRMQHIRDHLVHDGFRPEHMQVDGFLVNHLRDRGLIDRHTYDSIMMLQTVAQSRSHHRSHGSHRSHHCIQQVTDESVGASSSRSMRPDGRKSRVPNQTKKNRLTFEMSNAMGETKPKQVNRDSLPIENVYQRLKLIEDDGNEDDCSQSKSIEDHRRGLQLSNDTELYVHVCKKRINSLIGLTCISSMWKDRVEANRSHSTVGGAIAITRKGKTTLYGVTSGHGLVSQIIEWAPQSLDGYETPISEFSESSDSESEDEEDISDHYAKTEETIYDRSATGVALDLSDENLWTSVSHGLSVGFLGIDFPPTPRGQMQKIQSYADNVLSGDLALFPVHSLYQRGLTNRYVEQSTMIEKDVACISEEEIEHSLPVVILLGREQVVSGTLLPGKFHFSIRGTAVETSRVRLLKNLAMGSSGSWVVHNQTLYGMIVAVFPRDCLALMVPAKKMLCDIRAMFPDATNISVDINTWKEG